jgi:NAD(P)H dehydrogenase (quinone)
MVTMTSFATSQRARVAVVYDSGSRGPEALRGRTAKLAAAIAAGAEEVAGTSSLLASVAEMERPWGALAEANAIVFGCPTYMGSGSAAFKRGD